MEEVMQLLAMVQSSDELKAACVTRKKGLQAASAAGDRSEYADGMGYDVQEKSVDWARRIEKPTRRRKKVLNTIHVDEELQDMEWDMGSDGEVELP
jgi:hypothetical protein